MTEITLQMRQSSTYCDSRDTRAVVTPKCNLIFLLSSQFFSWQTYRKSPSSVYCGECHGWKRFDKFFRWLILSLLWQPNKYKGSLARHGTPLRHRTKERFSENNNRFKNCCHRYQLSCGYHFNAIFTLTVITRNLSIHQRNVAVFWSSCCKCDFWGYASTMWSRSCSFR